LVTGRAGTEMRQRKQKDGQAIGAPISILNANWKVLSKWVSEREGGSRAMEQGVKQKGGVGVCFTWMRV
jgi:hypothetical protein